MSKWLPDNEVELYLRNKFLNDKNHITIGPAQAYIEDPFNQIKITYYKYEWAVENLSTYNLEYIGDYILRILNNGNYGGLVIRSISTEIVFSNLSYISIRCLTTNNNEDFKKAMLDHYKPYGVNNSDIKNQIKTIFKTFKQIKRD